MSPLDQLLKIAIRIAEREHLLEEPAPSEDQQRGEAA